MTKRPPSIRLTRDAESTLGHVVELGGLVFSYDIVGTVRSFPHLLPPHQPNDQFESTLVG